MRIAEKICDSCRKSIDATKEHTGWLVVSETDGTDVGDLCPKCWLAIRTGAAERPLQGKSA